MIQHGRCVIAIAGYAERFFVYFAISDTGQDVASTSPHGGRFSRLQAQGVAATKTSRRIQTPSVSAISKYKGQRER